MRQGDPAQCGTRAVVGLAGSRKRRVTVETLVQITYIGHATVLIRLDGVGILTDPVLRERVGPLRRLETAEVPAVEEPLDAVLISHAHRDHLDVPSLTRLGHDGRLIAARAAVPALRRRGYQGPVDAVDPGDEVRIGAVVVRATPALHGRRGSAVGFALEGSTSVYFAGDTDLFPEMDGLVRDLDVALLPVWGWGPTLGPGHLDPARAAEATRLLRPRVAVPIHWGTLHPAGMARLSFLVDPPRAFERLARRTAPETEVKILRPGETLVLEGEN